jgi:UPF0755 protein
MRSRCRVRHAFAALAAAVLAACGGGEGTAKVVIPPGATFAAAAESLAAAGVIGSPRLFRAYASATKRDRAIQAGTYRIPRDASYPQLLRDLTEGRGLVHTVTIPEGWSLAQIAGALARAIDVPAESVMVAAADTALRRALDVPTPTIEGYLFPETYTFTDGTTAREAVATMVRQFEEEWKPEWTARLQALAMSRHDVVTLASIVEKEARIAEERPVIAAVYHNRLRRGMLLQADPTVQYALGTHVDRVLYKHLEVDSRYNTYKYAGLPPGPIASPGAASLAATVSPADVPFLYFVATPDGHHEFRRTFAEHSEAIRQIRRQARAAEGASARGR